MKTYDSISNEVRVALMQLTLNKGWTLTRACKVLNINFNSGKSIIRRARLRGNINRLNNQKKEQRAILNHLRSQIVQRLPLPNQL